MHRLSRIRIFFLIFIYLLNFYGLFSEGRYIALVYDDSRSMRSENRFCYANYALQLMISLLEEDDELYLFKMKYYTTVTNEVKRLYDEGKVLDPIPFKGLRDIGQRKQHIDTIYNEHLEANTLGTPYGAVIAAGEFLKDLKRKSGQDKEIWLIVITDGIFNRWRIADMLLGVSSERDRDRKIREYAEDFIRETNANIIFFGIGRDLEISKIEQWRNLGNLFELNAEDSESIIDRMNLIANLVTSKTSMDKQRQFYNTSNNEIYFQSEFPVRRIVLLQQGMQESFNELMVFNGEEMKNINHSSFNVRRERCGRPMVSLFADILHLYPDSGRQFASRKFNMVFREDVSDNDIQVFIEFDISFVIDIKGSSVRRSGQNIKALYNDKMMIEGYFISPYNNERIRISDDRLKDFVVEVHYGQDAINLRPDNTSKDHTFFTGYAYPVYSPLINDMNGIAKYKDSYFFYADTFVIDTVLPEIEVLLNESPVIDEYSYCSGSEIAISLKGKYNNKAEPIRENEIRQILYAGKEIAFDYDISSGEYSGCLTIEDGNRDLEIIFTDNHFYNNIKIDVLGRSCATHSLSVYDDIKGVEILPEEKNYHGAVDTRLQIRIYLMDEQNINLFQSGEYNPLDFSIKLEESGDKISDFDFDKESKYFYTNYYIRYGSKMLKILLEGPLLIPDDELFFTIKGYNQISLLHGIEEYYEADLMELSDSAPIKIIPAINKRPVTDKDEFDILNLKVSSRLRFNIKENQFDIKDGLVYGWEIYPVYTYDPAFTPTGSNSVKIEIRSNIPAEEYELSMIFNIIDAVWWIKYRRIFLVFLTILTFLIYLYGIIIRKRFGGSCYLKFELEDKGEKTYIQDYHLNKRSFIRYLVPYGYEKMQESNFTPPGTYTVLGFIAGETQYTIKFNIKEFINNFNYNNFKYIRIGGRKYNNYEDEERKRIEFDKLWSTAEDFLNDGSSFELGYNNDGEEIKKIFTYYVNKNK